MPKYYYHRLIRMRLAWILMYEQVKNVSFIARHFGISRKTFYKWYKRYIASNKNPNSLIDHPKKPKTMPRLTNKKIIHIIKKLRNKTNFGPDRLRLFLIKDYNLYISRSTIYYILKRENLIKKPKKHKKKPKIYNLPDPGDNVQIDIKIINGYSLNKIVQYSAQDDATRIKFTKLYPERANHYSVEFLNYIVKKFPFKIKQVSTDNDSVFTNLYTGEPKTHPLKTPRLHPFTLRCKELGIIHKLNRPASPNQNGKVERSHRTDDEEFYRLHKSLNLNYLIKKRKKYDELYNNHRPHMGLGGLTPLQKLQSYDKYKSVTYVFS